MPPRSTLSRRCGLFCRRGSVHWIAGAVVLLLLAGGVLWWLRTDSEELTRTQARITVMSGPGRNEPVTLDTTLYRPSSASAAHPVPAVLLAHGFGNSKDGVSSDARRLARSGYAVLTWSARGFGASTGQVHLNDPDYEVADAQRLIDVLAQRNDIARDGVGDPRVAAMGASYGGALALLLAGHDSRVDSVVAQITWNDLSRALFPNSAATPNGSAAAPGVLKKAWAGALFGSNVLRTPINSANAVNPANAANQPPNANQLSAATCGRLSEPVCRMYLESATTGRASAQTQQLLYRSSPASVIDRIRVPTLLLQGAHDTLFPLDQADANARGISANGAPVHVAWFNGGHDAGAPTDAELTRLRDLTSEWLGHYLQQSGAQPASSFSYSNASGLGLSQPGVHITSYATAHYPGLSGNTAARGIALTGAAQHVANPPNGTPAALSSLPGLGALLSLAGNVPSVTGADREINGEHAQFDSAPLHQPVTVVGAPTVGIRVSSSASEAVLFAKLYDVNDNGDARLINDAAAPLRLTGLTSSLSDAKPVTVTLPAAAYTFDKGHRLRLVLATADQAYSGPAEPALYTVALATNSPGITLPQVTARAQNSQDNGWQLVLAVSIAVVLAGVLGAICIARWRRGHGSRGRPVLDATLCNVPLAVRGLRKTYRGGFIAVSGVEFEVAANQVVGLLGPNGAGKTTTLRMLLGLIKPSGGEARIFGYRSEPGAPVLSNVGALVEGPGFLPHLSGRENLALYWRATGRPAQDAHMDDVLEVAALGEAIDRKVRTYSHGMKQRLAIAQAMLGMPRLLLLDEPTDGLDPPQIAVMRSVLQRYAVDGRAVLVSSHLLAEVEQTCSHVVVMHQGRSIAAGGVSEVIGGSTTVLLEVDDPERAAQLLRKLPQVEAVQHTGEGLVVTVPGDRSVMVAALVNAGIGIERVVPQRRLEDAFLSLIAQQPPVNPTVDPIMVDSVSAESTSGVDA